MLWLRIITTQNKMSTPSEATNRQAFASEHGKYEHGKYTCAVDGCKDAAPPKVFKAKMKGDYAAFVYHLTATHGIKFDEWQEKKEAEYRKNNPTLHRHTKSLDPAHHREVIEWMVDHGISHTALMDKRFQHILKGRCHDLPAKEKLNELILGVAEINRKEQVVLLKHQDVSVAFDTGTTYGLTTMAVVVHSKGKAYPWALMDMEGRGKDAESYVKIVLEIHAELRAASITMVHVVSDADAATKKGLRLAATRLGIACTVCKVHSLQSIMDYKHKTADNTLTHRRDG